MTAQPSIVPAGAPSWGDQTGFFQRHQPAFWLFVVILGICGLDFLAQQLQMLSAEPTAWVLTVLLLVPYAIPVIAIIYFLDLYEREPLSILVAALLWGGIAATSLSMYTNTPLMEVIYKVTGSGDFTSSWAAALTAPWVEETYKLLGVILLVGIARAELDDVLDGFVWGAMVGVGFLLVEDVFYFVRASNEAGSIGAVFQMFFIRILGAGPYSHFLYTGLTGMGVAYYVTRTDKPSGTRLLTAIGFIALGIGCHFFWNSPLLAGIADGGVVGWFAYVTIKGLPMLIGLILVVRLARRREQSWFAALTATFNDDGSITTADVAELGGLRARRRARNAAGLEKGPEGKRIKGLLQRRQLELAALFSQFGSEEHPAVAAKMAEVLGIKAQLASLGAVPALAGAAAGAWGQPAGAQPASPVIAWNPGAPAQPAVQPAPVAQPAVAQPQAFAPQPAAQPAPAPVAQPAPAAQAQPAPGPAASTGTWGAAPQPAAQAQPVAQPQPVVQAQPAPAPSPVAPAAPSAPSWAPTHSVPDGGLPAWSAPNPAVAPVANLDARLELVVAERAGDWARVVAVNGWTGWVDARRLVARG